MRILQVTPYFSPAWAYGGPPRVMTDFAVGLAARGHEVTVLTTDVLDESHRAMPRTEVMDGVHVTRYPNLSNSLAWSSKKYLPRGLLTGLVREAGRHDVVHVTDARTFVTASSFLGSLVRRVPLCLSAHGSLPGSTGVRGMVKRVYDTALVRPMLHRSPLLLAQTDHEARLYASFGGRESAIRLLPLPLPPIASGELSGSGSFRDLARRRLVRADPALSGPDQPTEGPGHPDRGSAAAARRGRRACRRREGRWATRTRSRAGSRHCSRPAGCASSARCTATNAFRRTPRPTSSA